jgi:hypothetical protein
MIQDHIGFSKKYTAYVMAFLWHVEQQKCGCLKSTAFHYMVITNETPEQGT